MNAGYYFAMNIFFVTLLTVIVVITNGQMSAQIGAKGASASAGGMSVSIGFFSVKEEGLTVCKENRYTKPGIGFKFSCKRGYGIHRISTKKGKFRPNFVDDILFKFSCRRLVLGEQVII